MIRANFDVCKKNKSSKVFEVLLLSKAKKTVKLKYHHKSVKVYLLNIA